MINCWRVKARNWPEPGVSEVFFFFHSEREAEKKGEALSCCGYKEIRVGPAKLPDELKDLIAGKPRRRLRDQVAELPTWFDKEERDEQERELKKLQRQIANVADGARGAKRDAQVFLDRLLEADRLNHSVDATLFQAVVFLLEQAGAVRS